MYDKVLTMVCQRPTGQLKPKNKIYTFFIFDIQLRTLRMVWIARRCLARFRFANAMPAGPSAKGSDKKVGHHTLCPCLFARAAEKSQKCVLWTRAQNRSYKVQRRTWMGKISCTQDRYLLNTYIPVSVVRFPMARVRTPYLDQCGLRKIDINGHCPSISSDWVARAQMWSTKCGTLRARGRVTSYEIDIKVPKPA